MKISDMMLREDFYDINRKTLLTYFDNYTSKSNKILLYVYPKLNAITTKMPSKDVKKFLYGEYKIRGNLIKRILVYLYTRISLNTFGLFADKKVEFATSFNNSYLIYPCNRKYRIFDFNSKTVEVIVKDGFPLESIKREIEFRECYSTEFILPILQKDFNWYKEAIINGTPLARISDHYIELCFAAINLLEDWNKNNAELVSASDYLNLLKDTIKSLHDNLCSKKDIINNSDFNKIINKLCYDICLEDLNIKIVLSHGDLQSGNIWVENGTGKIYIIDWESWDRRSIWYDRATLFYNIRKEGAIEAFWGDNDPSKFCLIEKNRYKELKVIIILEDIIYRLKELEGLPFHYGTDWFNKYMFNLDNIL